MKIRVGIDIDGVLRNFTGQVCAMAVSEGLNIKTEDIKEYYFLRNYHIEGESLARKIWTTGEWLEPVFLHAPVLDQAKQGYTLFCEDEAFEVYLVSAQPEGTEHVTEKWLAQNRFDVHYQTRYTNKKLTAPCQVLIDDKPQNVKEYQDNLRMGILINQPWNEDFKYSLRVDNLVDAYRKLKNGRN